MGGPDAVTLAAEELGRQLARRFFATRGHGRNVEVHLSEAELAGLLGFAVEVGVRQAARLAPPKSAPAAGGAS